MVDVLRFSVELMRSLAFIKVGIHRLPTRSERTYGVRKGGMGIGPPKERTYGMRKGGMGIGPLNGVRKGGMGIGPPNGVRKGGMGIGSPKERT